MARSDTDDPQLARRYLLRRLDDSELEQIEARLFSDPLFFEQVEVAEDDLIEAYARGDVSDADRAAMAEFMKDPDRQQRAQLASELRKRFVEPAVEHVAPVVVPMMARRVTPWWALAAAAGLVISAGAAVYAVLQTTAVRREMTVALEQRDAQLRMLSARVAGQSGPEASLLVEPADELRGGPAGPLTTVTLPPFAAAVSIRLVLATGPVAERYEVRVVRADGTQVWGGVVPVTPGRPPTLNVSLPASALPQNDYTARVSIPLGARVAGYPFRVIGG